MKSNYILFLVYFQTDFCAILMWQYSLEIKSAILIYCIPLEWKHLYAVRCPNAFPPFPRKANFRDLGNTGWSRKNVVHLLWRFRRVTSSHTSPPDLGELTLVRETMILEPWHFSPLRRAINPFKICISHSPPQRNHSNMNLVSSWTGSRVAATDNDHEVAGVAFHAKGSGRPKPRGLAEHPRGSDPGRRTTTGFGLWATRKA